MTCDPDTLRCQVERLADAATGFDMGGFLATLLATLVGAGVAAGVSFWLAERDRPRPMWKVEAQMPRVPERRGVFALEVVVTNIGDGTAYHPRVEVRGTGVTGERRGNEAVLEPGEMLRAWIGVPGAGAEGTDPVTGDPVDGRQIGWPDEMTAFLEWHQPPRRSRTQKAAISVTIPRR